MPRPITYRDDRDEPESDAQTDPNVSRQNRASWYSYQAPKLPPGVSPEVLVCYSATFGQD